MDLLIVLVDHLLETNTAYRDIKDIAKITVSDKVLIK